MPSFLSNDIEIAFLDEGVGEPILLIHGFASNKSVNWVETGWVETLVRAGFRVVALDNRGHGESDKLYDPEVYQVMNMAEDAKRLLDYLDIPKVRVMGYSMGARISAILALNYPQYVHQLVFGGMGYGMVTGIGDPEVIAGALEASRLEDVVEREARAFRIFAERTGSDRYALAACMRSSRQKIFPSELANLQIPVLVAVGEVDDISGSAEELAALMPTAQAFVMSGRNHMTAVGDKSYKAAVLSFFAS